MWDTRYRPLVFTDVLGQEGSVRVLRSRLAKGEGFNTSYIFSGGHGSGKTTLARILARAMLCLNRREDGDPCNECVHCLDCLNERMVAFTELDAASQGTTADMRRIVEHLGYDVPGVPKRIYLLDEAHRMSRDAQDVLLKPIEDKKVVVLFCTTEGSKIRDTIKSRCETYEIRKIQKEDILRRVQMILTREKVDFEDEAILTVIDYARGHVRDILNRLETVAQLGPVTLEAVRERLDLGVVTLYYDILLALGDASKSVELIESACDRVGPVQVATGIAEAAMNAFRQANKIYTDYSQTDRERASRVYERFGAEVVNVSRYFLAMGAYVSRLDLVCGAVAFGNAGTVVPAPVAVAAPPVVIVAPVAAALPAAPVVAPAPAAPLAAPAPVAPVVPAKTAPPAAPAKAPARTFVDGNTPMYSEEEAAMSAAPPRGAGSAQPVHKPPPRKVESRPPPDLSFAGFGQFEFTQTFNEVIRSLGNGK